MPNNKRQSFIIINFILLLSTSQIVFAQGLKKNRFDLKVSLTSMYDDNILKYSDKYINRFLNNEDQGRFDIDTYDDVYLKTKVNTSYYFKFFKQKKTKFSASFSNNSYINNPIKSWNYFGLSVRQYFFKNASVQFSYSFIPSFYVRQFRQYDLVDLYGYTPDTFKPYQFSKDNFSLAFQNTFNKTKIILNFSKAMYYLNSYYTEYDSDNLSGGISVAQPISKKVKLQASYLYTDSKAKGFDEIGETKETSDDSDSSFYDHAFGFVLKANLPRLKNIKNSLSLKVKYSKRNFTSKHHIQKDPLHVGRIDNNMRVYFSYDLKLSKKTTLGLNYNYLVRDSYNNQGVYDDLVSADKDYKQNQFGFHISYKIF